MATTSPDNLFSPNPSDNYNLIADWATSMRSVQTALAKRGNLYIGTAAQRTAFSTAPEGTHWQDTDGPKYEWVRQAGSWRGAEPLSGMVSASFPSSGGNTTIPVTFPSGFFSTTPNVIVSAGDGAGATVTLNLSAVTVSSTGFTVNATRSNGTTTRVFWTALPSK